METYNLSIDEKLVEIFTMIKRLESDAEFKKREIARMNRKLDVICRETDKMDKVIRQNDYLINAK